MGVGGVGVIRAGGGVWFALKSLFFLDHLMIGTWSWGMSSFVQSKIKKFCLLVKDKLVQKREKCFIFRKSTFDVLEGESAAFFSHEDDMESVTKYCTMQS